MKSFLLTISLLLILPGITNAQSDTAFWFAAPDLNGLLQSGPDADRPIFLRVSTGTDASEITITIPANTAFAPIRRTIAPNSSVSIDLTNFISQIEHDAVNTVQSKGLHLNASMPVSCYYDIVNGRNGDIYALKGSNALGLQFTVPFQMLFANRTNATEANLNKNDLVIVATEDNTSLTIRAKKDLIGIPAGTSKTVVLNKGQTYMCRAASAFPIERPGGTQVTADKPISISVNEDLLQYPGFGCADAAGDQLIPDALAGQEFVLVKGRFTLPNPDYYYVFATEDNTTVQVNGNNVVTLTTRGDFFPGQLIDESAFITTSKPSQLYHITGLGCEVGAAVIPSVKCTGSNIVNTTRAAANEEFHLNVLAPKDITGDFKVNGDPGILPPGVFQPVTGNAAWMMARITLPAGIAAVGSNVNITNPSGKFHAGVIQGGTSSTTRYGYFSDYSVNAVQFKDPNDPQLILGNSLVVCNNASFTLNADNKDATGFNWSGPNGFSQSGNPLKIDPFRPEHAGIYTVTTSGAGCGTASKEIELMIDQPKANFDYTTTGCSSDPISFTTDPSAGVKWIWNLGGQIVETTNSSLPPTVINQTGEVTVTLKVASARGCLSDEAVKKIPLSSRPLAGYEIPTTTCVNDEIIFSDKSIITAGQIKQWSWNLDDGNGWKTYSNNASQKATYTSFGKKKVQLVVTSSTGCISDVFVLDPFTVHPLPVAGFINPEVCLDDAKAIFTDTTSSPDGYKVFSYLWDFNAAATPASPGPIFTTANTTEQNPAVKYQKIGPYQVKLTVTARGCSSSVVQLFKVYGANPIPEFSVVPAAFFCSNDSVRIINNSTIDLDNVARIIIHWDDTDPTLQSLIEDPVIGKTYAFRYPSFPTPLSKPTNIRLQAFSGESLSCSKSVTKTIELKSAPKVTFNDMPGICLNADPRLVSEASSDIRVPGTLTFAGTGISTSGLFTPTTAGVGTFPIRALFTSVYGCKDSADKNITVWPIPTADFSNSNITCETDLISFTSSSQANAGSLAQWTWNFGDNTPDRIAASEDPVTHSFGSYNTYNVSLRVKTDNGCISDPKTIPIKVHPKPRVDFSLPNVCLPEGKAIFNNLSNIPEGDANAIQYKWNYGNAASTGTNGLHYFTSISNYPVNLVATSAFQCKDSSTKILSTIFKQPKAAFNALDSICIGKNISFTDQSITPDGNINQWFWNLDDGITSNEQDPGLAYTKAGDKRISLYIKNNLGCHSDTISKPLAVIAFASIRTGNMLEVLDDGERTIPAQVEGKVLSYEWLPSTYLSNPFALNPKVIKPEKDIRYTLRVTGGAGCVTSDTLLVRVLLGMVIPNTFTPNGDGMNDQWTIKNIDRYRFAIVEIHDPTGALVYRSGPPYQPWDGTRNGKPLAAGTYYYVIDPRMGRKRINGYVTLLR